MRDRYKKVLLSIIIVVSLIMPSYEASIYANSSYNSIIDMQINNALPPELQRAQKKVIEQLAEHYDKVKNYGKSEKSEEKRKKDIGRWVYDQKLDKWYFETDKNGRKVGWINPYGEEWYFLDFFTEEMKVGYHIIDGDVYYFEESKTGPVPLGQLYRSRSTPEGYGADETGKLVNYTRHKIFLQNINKE